MSMGKGGTQMEWPAVLQVINSHIYTPSSCFSPVSPRIIYSPFWPSSSVIGKLEMSHAGRGVSGNHWEMKCKLPEHNSPGGRGGRRERCAKIARVTKLGSKCSWPQGSPSG